METPKAIRRCLEQVTGGDLDSLPATAERLAACPPGRKAVRPEAIERAARKIALGKRLSPDDQFIAKAIIIPDRRPVIDIVQGDYQVSHPDWSHFQRDAGIRQRFKAAIPAVGRLDLPGDAQHPIAGTAFVVGPGLMMTNRHVAEQFCRGVGLRGLHFVNGAQPVVDFLRERDNYDDPIAFTVREVLLIHPYWDAAILRVEGLPEGLAPLRLSTASVQDMAGQDVAVIGHPLFDVEHGAPEVQSAVFRDIYGVKRLQPGKLGALAQIESFGGTVLAATHDCSTLGGNSGSAVISAATGHVVALHFGGRYLETNYAVPASELARDSRVVDTGILFSSTAEPVPDAFAEAWATAGEAGGAPFGAANLG